MGDRLRAGIGQLSLASLWGRLIEYQLGWGKSGNVTSSGWQVTLRDPTWHVIVSSRSGEACCELLYYVYVYMVQKAHANLLPNRLTTGSSVSVSTLTQTALHATSVATGHIYVGLLTYYYFRFLE